MSTNNADIILEVWSSADGYYIYNPSAGDRDNWDLAWWAGSKGWYYSPYRKTYRWRWFAVWVAKRLENTLNEQRRESERRRNFKSQKVWR